MPLFRDEFVHQNEAHIRLLLLKKRQIQLYRIHHISDAAAAYHHDRGIEHLCHLGVVKPYNGTDSAVPGSFYYEEVVLLFEKATRFIDFFHGPGSRDFAIQEKINEACR